MSSLPRFLNKCQSRPFDQTVYIFLELSGEVLDCKADDFEGKGAARAQIQCNKKARRRSVEIQVTKDSVSNTESTGYEDTSNSPLCFW